MKILKSRTVKPWYLTSLFLLLILGGKHLLDVRSGAAETGDAWLIWQYLLLLLICLLGVAGLGWLLNGKRKLETVYLAAGLLFGILYLCVLPPLSAPDEVSHYISAYQLSNHMMGKTANYETGHVMVRAEDWFIEDVYANYQYREEDGILVFEEKGEETSSVLGQSLTEETYRIIHDTGLFKHMDRGEADLAVSIYPPVVTTPLAYVPQALGMTLARLFGMNSLGLLYMGRLFNLLFFVGVTYLAMRRLPFGKEVLFGTALLPMTLHLSSSFSYDVLLMAGLFYYTACCLDLAYEKERVRPADVALLAALLAVIGPCKMIYTVFMGLCLLIPVRKFGGWKNWTLSAAAVAAALVISMILVNSRTIAVYAAETDSYVEWAGEAGYSFGMLLHNPMLLVNMIYNTVLWQAEHYHLTMIGAYLGNLDEVLDVPYMVIIFLTACLMMLAFRKPKENIVITGGSRIWIWTLCLACVGAAMLSMLIAWTPVSSPVINGVQGRYFLPFLPILLMTFKNNLVVLTKDRDRSILYLMCCANAYVLVRLFSIVSIRL